MFIIHNYNHLQSAVTTDPIPRYTRLKEFLKVEGAEPGRRLQGNGDKRVAVPSSESKYSPRPGNQVQSGCQSFVPSPSRTSAQHSMPKGPGHHQASYSSPTRTTPTKRREEAENQFESPGKRPKGMTARYPGRCGICSSPIRADVDMITVQREPKKTWIHLTCYGKT